jgi:hypothetical protein
MAVLVMAPDFEDFEGKDETDERKPAASWRRMLPPVLISGDTTKAAHFERRRAVQRLLQHLIIPMVFHLHSQNKQLRKNAMDL